MMHPGVLWDCLLAEMTNYDSKSSKLTLKQALSSCPLDPVSAQSERKHLLLFGPSVCRFSNKCTVCQFIFGQLVVLNMCYLYQ